jgi:hypothetical protein
MTIRELDARLDRERFKSLLIHAYIEGLQKEILASLNHILKRSHAGRQMVRGCATNYEPGNNPLRGAVLAASAFAHFRPGRSRLGLARWRHSCDRLSWDQSEYPHDSQR